MDLESIIRILAKSCQFNFTVIQPPFSGLEDFDSGLRKALFPDFNFEAFGRELFQKIPPSTLITTVDEFNCAYGMIRPKEESPVYLLGPVIRVLITEEAGKKICSQYGQSQFELFMRVYQKLRVEYGTDNLDFIKNLFAENYPEITFVQKEIPDFFPMRVLRNLSAEEKIDHFDDLTMQENSRQEILLMEAVTAGESQQAVLALEHLENFLFSDTDQDRYLSLKNQAMELNAICRYVICASQKVPPVYVLQIHKTYALQINTISSIQELIPLIRKMILDYCECVHQNSLEQYSPLIRRVIMHIRQKITNPLSLRALAEVCNVNASYLSNLFRSETGMTLTEYINRCRIEKSLPLLQHTQMSIAKVSEAVGFLDENYYARIFKKIMGVPPKTFRQHNRK